MNESYLKMFERYGSMQCDSSVTIRSYQTRPDQIARFESIRTEDDRAARTIAECKRLITQLIAYREALAKRYGELATMNFTEEIELQRYQNYAGRITYYIRRFRIYEDGTRTETETTTYTGKERHKALAYYSELKRTTPAATFSTRGI